MHNLTDPQRQEVRDAADAIAQGAVRDPKTEMNPARIFEIIEPLTEAQQVALVVELAAIHMSTSAAFQRSVYAPGGSPLNIAAAGMATACIAEVLAFIGVHWPGIFDREAAARRASFILGEARRISLTAATAQIILPEDKS